MPLLHWLNKDEALNTARHVCYRLLEAVPALSAGDADTRNMLIQGDNLDALKALLPLYAGQVKCIYIDPPYNTKSAFECAKAIDSHPKVKHWVRNLVNREQASFRLPLAKGYFYPDFVAELIDGRLLVVEYKGEVYKTNDDSREKNTVGSLWAEKSGGKCLYLMAVESDTQGRNVYQQIDGVVGE